MAEYSTVIEVPRTPDEVYAYVRDLTAATQWDPSVLEATRVDDGPLAAGSRFKLVVAFYGRRIELDSTLAEAVDAQRVVFRGTGRAVRACDEITIEANGAGSSVRLATQRSLTGPMKLFDKGLQVALAGAAERAAKGLQAALGG